MSSIFGDQVLYLILWAFALSVILMCGTFVIALWFNNYSIVDIAWSAGFTPVVLLFFFLGEGWFQRKILAALLVGLWSSRLAIHLLRRIVHHHPQEDSRYLELRARWKERPKTMFFGFYLLQAVALILLAAPFSLAFSNATPSFSAVEWLGAGMFFVAWLGESLADAQLSRFKNDPSNRGKTCQSGLWRYSRHPNYFFEWLIWCGFALLLLGSPWGWVGLYCPLLILYLLLRVTGVPMAEEQSLKSRGEEYRRYQAETSVFFPWFKRRPRHAQSKS